MSDYEIKATVLGFHPEHGELIAASEAKEAIAHFNDIAKAELAKDKEDYKTLFSAFESCQDELKKANERVAELEKERSNLSAKYKKNVSVIGAFVSELTGKVIILPKMRTKEEIEKSFNKFAIEKKIESVNWFSENYCDDEHSFLADKAIEQLRKEQE